MIGRSYVSQRNGSDMVVQLVSRKIPDLRIGMRDHDLGRRIPSTIDSALMDLVRPSESLQTSPR